MNVTKEVGGTVINWADKAASSVQNQAHELKEANWTMIWSQGVHKVGMTMSTLEKDLANLNTTEIGQTLDRLPSKVSCRIKQVAAEYERNATNPSPGSYHMSWPCVEAAAAVGGISLAALPMFMELIGVLGFGAEGVGLDSIASKWQSIIGDVEAGSLFATLQSISMAGFSGSTYVWVPTVGAETASLLCTALDANGDNFFFTPSTPAPRNMGSKALNIAGGALDAVDGFFR